MYPCCQGEKLTLKYYFKLCFWGLGGCGSLVYIILADLHDGKIYSSYIPYMPYIAAYLAIGAVAFPFAYFSIKKLALKTLSKQAWGSYFSEDSPSWGAFVFIYLLCVLFVVPLCIVYLFIKETRPEN